MQMMVIRPISGVDAGPGDVVDTTEWRNAEALVRQRYLRPVAQASEHPKGDEN